MGTDLRYRDIEFFKERMRDHSCVESFSQVEEVGEIVFRINRKRGLPPVNVHLSDTYRYGLGEYLARPRSIGRGDFILIAAYAGEFDEGLVTRAWKEGIGIGRIGKLMGALNKESVWDYRVPRDSSC
jgi:hypothetical protein